MQNHHLQTTVERSASSAILEKTPPDPDFRLAYGPDPSQFGELRLPPGEGPHPVAMVYHGGFWRDRYDLGTAGHMCAALTRVGVATWNVEYRRVGRGGDQWPETEYDVARSSSFLEEVAARYHLDLRRTVAVGFSAGGQLAMWLAAHRPWFRGVVSLAGVSDLRLAWKLRLSDNAVEEFLGGAPDSRPDACPMNLHITVTQRLVHGQDDTEVPIEIARAYVRSKSEREVVNLTELHNTGHYELIDPNSNAWATVEQIILGLLGQ